MTELCEASPSGRFFDTLRPPAQPGASDVRESLAVFAPAGANEVKSVFSGDMCGGENTSQPASVEAVRQGRAASAHRGLYLIPKSGSPLFGWYEALTSGDLP